jgi:hypothetical protein
MAKSLYTKIVQGCVEQVYDDNGNCLSQEFVPFEGAPVDRRIMRAEGEQIEEGDLENDEVIEHPEDIAAIEAVEKFQSFDMVQPT